MSADAGGLRCPNCGAAADPDAGRCAYCQARLATMSCPACFALMFQGAAFCPACGAARARAETEETALRCPGCRGDLERVALDRTALYECRGCDGVWVDADVFERLCADREAQAAVLPRLTPSAAPKTQTTVRYRPCARCAKMMNRVNFGTLSGAIVDVCKGHGTFLDTGELHQIVTFVQTGGLDRARRQKVEELREEERKVRNAQWKATRDSSHNPQRGATPWRFDERQLSALIDLIADRPETKTKTGDE
jgi:Zn-finger nucleic acid-binding protein